MSLNSQLHPSILILAYGNPNRSDNRVGGYVIQQLLSKVPSNMQIVTSHQLVIEWVCPNGSMNWNQYMKWAQFPIISPQSISWDYVECCIIRYPKKSSILSKEQILILYGTDSQNTGICGPDCSGNNGKSFQLKYIGSRTLNIKP